MAQQMKNGSHYEGSKTVTIRDTDRYAVVNDPFTGKHRNKQSCIKRKMRWVVRNLTLPMNTVKYKEAVKFVIPLEV